MTGGLLDHSARRHAVFLSQLPWLFFDNEFSHVQSKQWGKSVNPRHDKVS